MDQSKVDVEVTIPLQVQMQQSRCPRPSGTVVVRDAPMNVDPENRPFPKDMSSSNHQISGAMLIFSGYKTYTIHP